MFKKGLGYEERRGEFSPSQVLKAYYVMQSFTITQRTLCDYRLSCNFQTRCKYNSAFGRRG